MASRMILVRMNLFRGEQQKKLAPSYEALIRIPTGYSKNLFVKGFYQLQMAKPENYFCLRVPKTHKEIRIQYSDVDWMKALNHKNKAERSEKSVFNLYLEEEDHHALRHYMDEFKAKTEARC